MQSVAAALQDIARINHEIRDAAGGNLTRFVSLRHQLDGACRQFADRLGAVSAAQGQRAALIRMQDQFVQLRQMLAQHQKGWTLAEVICLPEDYAVSAASLNQRISQFVDASLRSIVVDDAQRAA